MRTSRASKETAKVLQALSPPARRQTRSAALGTGALRSFAYNADSAIKGEINSELFSTIGTIPATRSDDDSSLSSVNTADIEDLVEDVEPPSKRRKRNASPRVLSASNRTPRKPLLKKEDSDKKSTPPSKARRMPARKTRDADGAIVVEPPSNWETMYNIVKKMRADNPTAPVDTMGCSELYWRASSPRDRRFQTLIALMLSSQTKDTVTAVAMQRLHTELGDAQPDRVSTVKKEDFESTDDVKIKPEPDDTLSTASLPIKDSTLNLENILAVTPTRLNTLIEKVGFHNNKTKYIKAAALILRDEYNGDIPSTPEGLMSLPGVGPKMAYLCMSAAWGKHEGIGVDVHVHRITNLWGWHKTKTPEETRMALQSWLPRDKWHEINKLLVGLGQTACQPVKRRCGECYLAGTKLCKSEIKGLSPVKREGGATGSPGLDEPKIKIEAL
ncbi:DNA polymerase alpha-associated DNA helicase A [Penicillium subrubescens]|uniref:Endonuclease III homolog n=1 Tax=Penicillium subrubescens TaxID=1316194 RepID=A0A1Q5TBK3_9EURO|nr:DNA polymerase alpha-associated DNA helicase A [Penicillium subrubescens]KAJ5892141.1 DNA polymerase alpha-associated DNA helicase A [Penicillium subrubescens]OKO97624.1 Endonuclease III -like protein [Penicillium subrubescens]